MILVVKLGCSTEKKKKSEKQKCDLFKIKITKMNTKCDQLFRKRKWYND